MAEIIQLKQLIDAYGVGVRAGIITPQSEDEIYFRDLMDLPTASKEVLSDWKEAGNVRKPLTIKGEDQIEAEQKSANDDE